MYLDTADSHKYIAMKCIRCM